MDKWDGYFPIPNNRNKERVRDTLSSQTDDNVFIDKIEEFLCHFEESELYRLTYVTYNSSSLRPGINFISLIFDTRTEGGSILRNVVRLIIYLDSINFTSIIGGYQENESYIEIKDTIEKIKQLII